MQTFKSLFLMLALLISVQGYAAPVDINTADADMLAAAIDGVGEKKAATIVQYRETNGPFASVDELVNIKGIGAGTVDRNREKLTVTTPSR